MSREAVLLQWERKIEDAERLESGRFDRDRDAEEPVAEPVPLRPAQPVAAVADEEPAERRAVTIAGHPTPARRRHSLVETQMAQPDRIALWAFLLGLFLVAVAAGTAHA